MENLTLDFGNFFKGCICYNEKEEAGVLLSIEPYGKDKEKYRAVGVYLKGDFNCEYRRTWIQEVTTRKGWKGKKLRMIGFIDGNDLEKAIQLVDTGQSFGTKVDKE